MLRLHRAEQSVIELQRQAMQAVGQGQPVSFETLEVAMANVARSRDEVYRMARQ